MPTTDSYDGYQTRRNVRHVPNPEEGEGSSMYTTDSGRDDNNEVPPHDTEAHADGTYAEYEYQTTSIPSIYIGTNASHVTVHIHHYHSSTVGDDYDQPLDEAYAPAVVAPNEDVPAPSRAPPPPPPPQRAPLLAPAATATTTPSVHTALSSALAALPEGLLSPSVQAVVRQVLEHDSDGRTREVLASSPIRTHSDNTGTATTTRTTTTRDGASETTPRRQNVSISLMMQPLTGGNLTATSLTDLLHRLTGDDADITPSTAGLSLADLNRHTTLTPFAAIDPRNALLHDTCGICQESLTADHLVRTVRRCGHGFHAACLDQWLEANSTCPMCMQHIVPAEAHNGDDVNGARSSSSVSLPSLTPLAPPPPPPPPPPPQPSMTVRPPRTPRGAAASPPLTHTTMVLEQVDALLSEAVDADGTSRTFTRASPARVRRIPIRVAQPNTNTNTNTDTGTGTGTGVDRVDNAAYTDARTDALLDSALREFTLESIEEVDDGDTDEDYASV